MHVLLTNDDGVGAPGLDALYDEFAAAPSVTRVSVVAPAEDRSGVGRANSHAVGVEERDRGVVVDGTPCDCVAVGLRTLDPEPDVVVSGVNDGPNVGAHKLGRSGTVSAAKEAAFLDVPGVAVSLYDPVVGNREFEDGEFDSATDVARFLVERADALADRTYLNVNAPVADERPPLRVTRPTSDFDVRVEETDDELALRDCFYDPLRPDRPEELDDPVGTDRRALADGEISVSPLGVGHETRQMGALVDIADDYA